MPTYKPMIFIANFFWYISCYNLREISKHQDRPWLEERLACAASIPQMSKAIKPAQPETVIGASWRIYASIGAALLVIGAVAGYVFYAGLKVRDHSSPLLSAVREIQLEFTTAQLWVEEALDGEMDYDAQGIWEHVDDSIFYFRNLIQAREPGIAGIGSAFKRDIDGRIERLRKEYKNLRALVERHLESSGPVSGQQRSLEFRESFSRMLQELKAIEQLVVDSMLAGQSRFRTAHTILITICVLLVVGMGLVIRRYERTRNAAYTSLSETNARLNQEIETRNQAERLLKESERFARTVFQTSPDAISITRLEDNTFVDVNDGFVALTGYRKEDLIGRTPLDLGLWEAKADRESYLSKLNESGKIRNLEACFRIKDGLPKIGLVSANIIEFNGVRHILSVARDITELKKAEEAFQKYHKELEQRVKERTIELSSANEQLKHEIEQRKRTEEELLRYETQLREMASQLMETEERERRRIGTEIHDRIGQALAVIQIKLGSFRQSLQSPDLVHQVDEIRQVVSSTTKETRTLTFEISPPILYELGLSAAVGWLAESVQKQHGLSIRTETDESDAGLDIGQRAFLFRAMRELLFNVVKHAQARNVAISITGDDHAMKLDIQDDGIGFNPSGTASTQGTSMGFGLFSIRERLRHYGGMIEIDSGSGAGTRIILTLPREVHT